MTYAKLTGITSEQGRCSQCGRELGRVFAVVYVDGSEGQLGRRCASKATGWAAGAVEREANRLARLAERDARRAIRRQALEPEHGPILAWLESQPTSVATGGSQYASVAYMLLCDILDGCDGLLPNAYALRDNHEPA